MKGLKKPLAVILIIYLITAVAVNCYLLRSESDLDGVYRIEAKRLGEDLAHGEEYDKAKYPHITGLFSEADGDLFSSESPYVIINVGGRLYRAEYKTSAAGYDAVIIANTVLILSLLFTVGVLVYVNRHILKPFNRLNTIPEELAKGNLAAEIPEEKSRYFGKFTWGVNMLRESIEDSRKKELSLLREKKLLLLSLSHDIKTPLSAIKLNSQALSRGLYKDEEKRREAAKSINTRADEIERYVQQITQAASEDFMSFTVKDEEAFINSILDRIDARYRPILSNSGTEFVISEHSDCILRCDADRLAECIQNLVDNAVKYGDGREIRLDFGEQDGCMLITVSNTGCTLEPAELTQIFESFRRGSNASKAKGSGLGLYICRKLMRLMGGETYADIRDGRFEATLVVKLA